MPVVTTVLKISLTRLAKALMKDAPGTAYTAVNGVAVVGEIAASESLGQQSKIYIPVYGPAGIDAGVVSYTAVSLGWLAGLGAIAAAAAGVTLAPGIALLALGVGVVGRADILHGGAGDDLLQAAGNGDTLDGGDGDDVLKMVNGGIYTANGTTFIGGKGNDTITSGFFNNTFIFNLDEQVLKDPQGRALVITPGMQVVAEINQGKRTVLEYLLSPVQKAVQESGRER